MRRCRRPGSDLTSRRPTESFGKRRRLSPLSMLALSMLFVGACGASRNDVHRARPVDRIDGGRTGARGSGGSGTHPDAASRCSPPRFADPHVESAIRANLADPSEPIPLDLTFISIEGAASLEGLECFTALTSLDLYRGTATSLSPLVGLTNLQELYVSGYPVADVSPLAGLHELRRLTVSLAPLSDIRSLAGLALLETLSLSETEVFDLGALQDLPRLRVVSVNNTKVASIAPLSHATTLFQLDVSRTLVTDLSPITFPPSSSYCALFRATDTPLDENSKTVVAPALCALGWQIEWNRPGEPEQGCTTTGHCAI